MLGRDTIAAAAGVLLAKAVTALCAREKILESKRWQALEYLAIEYLNTPEPDR